MLTVTAALKRLFIPLAQDDKWITVKPNGPDAVGIPALIGSGGEIKAGMGGKFDGENIKDLGKTTKKQSAPIKKPASTNPRPDTAHGNASVEMTPREVEAMQNYSGAMYKGLNERLRAGKGASRGDAADLKEMDKAFARASTVEPMTVYRGIGPEFAKQLKPGVSFTDGGFTSTTSSRDIAEGYSTFGGSGGAVMEVRVPKGAKAISLKDTSAFGGKTSVAKSEEEILLNRGGKYRVVEVIQDKPKTVKGRDGRSRRVTPPPRIIVEVEA